MITEMMDDPNRHQENSVIVIDLKISEMRIIELAKSCIHLPIRKKLLTELERIHMGSLGLNNNPLDRLVCKSDKSLNDTFLYYIDELTLGYFREMTSPFSYWSNKKKPVKNSCLYLSYTNNAENSLDRN